MQSYCAAVDLDLCFHNPLRWETVETQLHSQNIRMTNMETQINQLSGLSKSVSETSTNVRKIDEEVKTLKSKATEYEESVHFYNGICDTLINSNTELKDRLATLEQNQVTNDDKLIDLQWRGMRKNLVFSGSQNHSWAEMNMKIAKV